MRNNLIPGGEYRIFDKLLQMDVLVKVYSIRDGNISYKSSEYKGVYHKHEVYNRRFEDVDVLEEVEVENAKRLNSQSIFSVQDNLVRGVIGRSELLEQSKVDFRDLKKDKYTALISITDPDREDVPKEVLDKFSASFSLKFWDVEEAIGRFGPITREQGDQIRTFIKVSGCKNFVVHCEAGQSRSAAVALAIYFFHEFNEDFEKFEKSKNPIMNHHRYDPNLTVLDAIVPREVFSKK